VSLDESGRLYLADYFLLEGARKNAIDFLKEIATNLEIGVQEHFKGRSDSPIRFNSWVRNNGGAVEFSVNNQDLPALASMGEWKFAVCYGDAIETERLSDPTKCRIYATTPQAHAAQSRAIKLKAKELGLPDPYENAEFDLIGESAEDVVDTLTAAFVERLDNYVQIVKALASEKPGQAVSQFP